MNRTCHPCRLIAAAGLACLLVASLLHVLTDQPLLSQIIGWTGVVYFELAALCVLQYARLNRPPHPRTPFRRVVRSRRFPP